MMIKSRVVLLVAMSVLLSPLLGTAGGGHPDSLGMTRGADPPDALDAPFSPDVNVSDDPTFDSQVEPHMVVDDLGYIHVGWIDWRSGLWRVRYAKSTNGGLSFEPSIEMPDTTHLQTADPVLAYANGALYYAWISYTTSSRSDVAMRVSHDRGLTWG
ncbi:MAG: hypothetical protein ACE5IJ_05775, partial [Thermoplasmata archaeon]